jgi:hypothetical protein
VKAADVRKTPRRGTTLQVNDTKTIMTGHQPLPAMKGQGKVIPGELTEA